MKKYLYKIIFLLLLAFNLKAQEKGTVLSAKEERTRIQAKMTIEDFQVIVQERKEYRQRLQGILGNRSLSNDQRMQALNSLHQEHNAFMKNHLSDDQRSRLGAIARKDVGGTRSRWDTYHQQQLERLRKKGAKITPVTKK